MATPGDIGNAKGEAQEALFKLITETVKEIQDDSYTLASHATRTRDLALAYRYLAGGAQPGSGDASK